MGSSSGTALGIIGIILSAGAIGFAFFVWNGQNTTNSGVNSDLDDLIDELNNLKSDFNNLTDQFDILTELNNVTGLDNFTDALNNLTGAFNNLRGEFNNLTRTIVVGEWDTLDDNYDYAPHNLPDDWLYEFGGNNMNNTDCIAVSNSNTRITLLKSGWYRIHLTARLWDISISSTYKAIILKDGAIEFILDYLKTGAALDNLWHNFDSSAFVYSDGTNYIELNGFSNTDEDFEPYPGDNQMNNQLTIEYVAI